MHFECIIASMIPRAQETVLRKAAAQIPAVTASVQMLERNAIEATSIRMTS